MDFLQYKL